MYLNGASGQKTYNRSSATYSYNVGSNGGTGTTFWTNYFYRYIALIYTVGSAWSI